MSGYPVTLGVEEEVFVLEKDRLEPTLQSLDYLRKLLWANPRRYMRHSASNFARGEERRECFMGSIEIATHSHTSVDELLADLRDRRKDFAKAAEGGMIVPVGSLFTLSSPCNTASTHVHIGVPPSERSRVYGNIAYFAPVFAVAAGNSPWAAGQDFGFSYRMAQPGCLGPLRENREYRFQDVILSKRLGTVELRLLDPIPEWDRLTAILNGIAAVAAWRGCAPFDRDDYNRHRKSWTRDGLTTHIERLWLELQQVHALDRSWLTDPLTDRLRRVAASDGIPAAYAESERLWLEGTAAPSAPRPASSLRKLSGLGGYYLLRLPFMAFKGYKEWFGKLR